MTPARLVERVIDLPAAIVWEGLVDPELAEGWLHPRARLTVERVPYLPPSSALETDDEVLGRVRVTLDAVPGGTRGESSRVTVEALDEGAPHPSLIALWRVRADQLEDLLRGHPVDWARWTEERGPGYQEHLRRAARADSA